MWGSFDWSLLSGYGALLSRYFGAVPKILRSIWSSHMSRPKLLLVQIWSYSFDSIWYGSQNQVFDVIQWGNGRQDGPVLSLDRIYGKIWVLESHKLLELRCGRTDISCGSNDLTCCSRTPTTHVAPPRINFCPGPTGCLRSTLWDWSEYWSLLSGYRFLLRSRYWSLLGRYGSLVGG